MYILLYHYWIWNQGVNWSIFNKISLLILPTLSTLSWGIFVAKLCRIYLDLCCLSRSSSSAVVVRKFYEVYSHPKTSLNRSKSSFKFEQNMCKVESKFVHGKFTSYQDFFFTSNSTKLYCVCV